MSFNLNCIFQYITKEDIILDKEEFIFQMKSHPDYPSILSISDTLTFFNIQNAVIRVEVTDIDLLPEHCVVLLKENNGSNLYYLEKKEYYHLFDESKKSTIITKKDLESRWDNLVVIIEKSETEYTKINKKNRFFWLLPSLFFLLFFTSVKLFGQNWQNVLFLLFPFTGFILSIMALKDLFGTKSDFFESLCNLTVTTDCNAVVGSKKWKIFAILNFSDLSIVFFASQILSLSIFLLQNDTNTYFSIQKILLTFALPIVVLSIFYQKKIEKKWCPICLMISAVIILEWIYVTYLYTLNFSLHNIIVFALLFVCCIWLWSAVKKTLNDQKELKEFQLVGNRFMRNYEIFKNTLVATDSFNLPESPIVLGNKESNTEITIITSPFCGHCKKAHKILENILVSNHDNLKIKILINVNFEYLDEQQKTLVRSLMSIYLKKGSNSFLEALNDWFDTKNLKSWIEKHEFLFDLEQVDYIFKQHSIWCANNNFNFTPIFFINDYQYPKKYNRENLEFFINELVEDNFLELA